jgi:hypothetical protein
MESTKQIRQELVILRKKLISEGVNENNALTQARQEMNKKYGKGWREQREVQTGSGKPRYKEPSIYDGHIHGEHWMD